MTAESASFARALDHARELLEPARRVVVFTGAGVSAESGVPTFRGAGGLWRNVRPEDLATPDAFVRDPHTVWEWYAWRRALVAQCRPNAAHLAIARWTAEIVATGGTALVATQNVDGLHQRAAADVAAVDGVPAAPVLALHGSLFGTRCSRCAWRAPEDEDATTVAGATAAGPPRDTASRDRLPRCPVCGALLRPAVVWFGEGLDPNVIGAAFAAAATADLCLVVGTSALVHPAAGIATTAARAGATLIEVNAEATPLSDAAAVSVRGRAAEVIPRLLSVLPSNP